MATRIFKTDVDQLLRGIPNGPRDAGMDLDDRSAWEACKDLKSRIREEQYDMLVHDGWTEIGMREADTMPVYGIYEQHLHTRFWHNPIKCTVSTNYSDGSSWAYGRHWERKRDDYVIYLMLFLPGEKTPSGACGNELVAPGKKAVIKWIESATPDELLSLARLIMRGGDRLFELPEPALTDEQNTKLAIRGFELAHWISSVTGDGGLRSTNRYPALERLHQIKNGEAHE